MWAIKACGENLTIMGGIFGICLAVAGLITIQAARFPSRNSFYKIVFRMTTSGPRVALIPDETWVMFNGIGLFVAGISVLCLSLLGVIQ